MGQLARFLILPALLVASLSGPASAFDKARSDAVLSHAVADYIRPTFHTLHLATDALKKQTAATCANPSAAELARLKTTFTATVTAWSRAEIITFGPSLQANRLERFNFFPDRKSLGLKQMQDALGREDPGLLDPASLAGKSVAIQGLGAFELLFFGSYPESVTGSPNTFKCRYGKAIAANLDRMASDMAVAWVAPDGVSASLTRPGPDNAAFRNDKEAVTALLGFMVHGMEMWRERRIELFWRGKAAKPKPRMAVFWRSGSTMAALTANLEGMRDLWTKAGMETLLDDDVRSVSGSILFDLNALIKTAGSLEQPDSENLADPKYAAKLDYMLLTSRDLLLRINDEYGKAIGLGAGFSFSDGD